jgi:hypothetical protein
MSNIGIARLIQRYDSLRSEAEKSSDYDLLCLAIDFEAAWNRPDLLTDKERHILTELFMNGTTASTLSAETGLPEQMIYSIMHSGLDKLRDDLNGYTTAPEPYTPPEAVPDCTDKLLTDYDDDGSDPYAVLSERQLRKRQEREVSYEQQYLKQGDGR